MDTSDEWVWVSELGQRFVPINIPFTGDLPGPKGCAVGIIDPLKRFHLFCHLSTMMKLDRTFCMPHNNVLQKILPHHGNLSQKLK